ncbi:MAG: DNA polymerase Y family protein [Actinomycetota bacterium]|nr:DNA polymerase Y family protein [Actinomycetota bacterium]
MNGVRTLVVWCPDWPVVAAGLCDRPAAVLAAGRVVACSASARAEGVARGLRRRQAEARCPPLVVVDHDPAAGARAFEPVVAAVESFTTGVEIVRPGICALATRGPSRYFGGDETLAARVASAVDGVLAARGLGVPACRVGVADGPFAAERAAREGLIVPAGASAAFLAGFPVSALGDGELADLLVRLGIRSLGQLAGLPAPAVLARFGPTGAAAHRLARGLDERPLAARTPPPDFAVATALDPPAERLETAAFVAKNLADRLHEGLGARGLAATRVLVEAEWEHGERLARRWRLDGDGGRTAAALAERVRWQLDGWMTGASASPGASAADRPSGGLTLLRLSPEEVRPDDGRQVGFWGGDQAAAERVARALARIQGMLGPDAVVTAVPAGGRSPAEQVRLVPWGETPPDAVVPKGGPPPWPGRIPSPSPAVVHPIPIPAEVVEARLSVAGGRWAAVTAWAGPWPVDERWWDAAAHRRRSRWQVVTDEGAAHLLSQVGDGWEVEATYD